MLAMISAIYVGYFIGIHRDSPQKRGAFAQTPKQLSDVAL